MALNSAKISMPTSTEQKETIICSNIYNSLLTSNKMELVSEVDKTAALFNKNSNLRTDAS